MESQDPEALDVIELKDDTRKIYTLLDRVLTPRERQVLIMRYGLYQGKEYTAGDCRRIGNLQILYQQN